MYNAIGETLTVVDAASQAPQRVVNLVNQSADSGCHARVNDDATDYTILQAALDAAQPGDLIKIAGRCSLVNHYGGLAQVAYISKSLTLQGGYTATHWTTPDPAANPTILDAQGRGRVLYITGDITPTIQGLWLTGGDADGLGPYAWGDVGGGVYINTATAVISGNQVYSNSAYSGGGLFLDASDATLKHNRISDNSVNESGAGVYLRTSPATLAGNTIVSNIGDGWGGGVCLVASNATLSDNTIANNHTTQYGGGVSLSSGSDATLNDNHIYHNKADRGGGLQSYFSSPILSGNVVTGNQVTWRGGGLELEGGSPRLINTVVADNQAAIYGSGIHVIRSAPRLLHTTLARNGSSGDGSAIYVTNDGFEYSNVALTNTIIYSHSVGISVTAGNAAALNTTLWYANATPRSGNVSHSNDRDGDPFFDPAGHHLTSISAAIDRGLNVGTAVDVDGQTRPEGAACDIGADEFVCVPLAGVTINGPSQGVNAITYVFTASVTQVQASLPVTFNWSPSPVSGQAPLARWSSASYTWNRTGSYVITVTASNCGASRSITHAIAISATQYVYLPLILRENQLQNVAQRPMIECDDKTCHGDRDEILRSLRALRMTGAEW
jgi:parallel beta-helix repeat protein